MSDRRPSASDMAELVSRYTRPQGLGAGEQARLNAALRLRRLRQQDPKRWAQLMRAVRPEPPDET
ncbi:hypothetical protein ABIA33_006843 [Streptacidiphilus sp. MAP12-16]|jgi:hypothetical protein|uniref:hypothetical protein n=1 Tax=Streptacidiphilus sp. MAP12-16 TaxID=3156300 RepID=UPI003512D3EA